MKKAKLRIVEFCLGLIALAFMLSLPAKSKADGLGDSHPNRFQHINPGSYSPCHWWVPSLYTCRAYHRPARLYDQSQWDGGGDTYSVASGSCDSHTPPPAKKPDEKK